MLNSIDLISENLTEQEKVTDIETLGAQIGELILKFTEIQNLYNTLSEKVSAATDSLNDGGAEVNE